MGLRINQNIAALNAARNLRKTDSAMSKSLERLSSGFRVNRAADDPAGLIISENLRAQISGLGQAVKNAQNAVNLISTAEAALDEVLTQLRSIRTLALDALNTGASDSVAIAADQTQIASSISTLTRVGNNSQFGKIKLLDGSAGISGSTNDVSKLTFVKGGTKTVSGTYDVTNLTAATKGAQTFNINNEFEGVGAAAFDLAAGEKAAFKIDFGNGVASAGETAAIGADLKAAGLVGDTSQSGITVTFDEASASAFVVIDQTAGGFTANDVDGATSLRAALNKTSLGNVVTFNDDNVTGGTDDAVRITGKFAGLSFGVEDITVADAANTASDTGFTSTAAAAVGSGYTMADGDSVDVTFDFGAGTTLASEKAALGAALVAAGLATDSGNTTANVTVTVKSVDATNAKATISIAAAGGAGTNAQVLALINSSSLGKFVTAADGGGGEIDVTSAIGAVAIADSNSVSGGASGLDSTATGAVTALAASEVANLGDGITEGANTAQGSDAIKVLQETLTFNGDKVVNVVSGTALVNVANSIQQQLTALGVAQTVSFTKDTGAGTDNKLTFTNDNFGSRLADGGRVSISSNRSSTPNSHLKIGTTNVDVEGTNVVGKINTKDATGVGQVLTLDSPGDNADGVAVKFTGTSGATGLTVSVTAGTLQFQVGANSGQVVSQGLPDVRANKLGLTATGLKTTATSVNDIDVTTADGASDALILVDAAIAEITTIRGELGAFQSNVLEATISSLGAAQENLAAAESSIRDADFAEETVTFTRNQILLQAGTSILTQANAIPQAVLQLLQ